MNLLMLKYSRGVFYFILMKPRVKVLKTRTFYVPFLRECLGNNIFNGNCRAILCFYQ